MGAKQVVAWQVSDCEGYSAIVFHHHRMAAKRLGADEFGGEFDDVEIKRTKEFDRYAESGKVPIKVLIENGWWFECSHCGQHVTDENENPVIDGEHVYCGQKCHDDYEARIKTRNDEFEAYKAKIQAARPFLLFTFTGGWPLMYDSARFSFDGCNSPGVVEINKETGEPEFYINKEDEPAWLAYKAKVGA